MLAIMVVLFLLHPIDVPLHDVLLSSCLLSSPFSSTISDCNCSMRSDKPSISSLLPVLNSSMILNTHQSRSITIVEPTSSSSPFRQTSRTKLATMTVASRQWNFDLKYLILR